jgi:hypothetical protein
VRITSISRSIANVVSRFSVVATVMLRNGNTETATWPQHDCADPKLKLGNRLLALLPGGERIEAMLLDALERGGCLEHGIGGNQPAYLPVPSQVCLPASYLFQRLS